MRARALRRLSSLGPVVIAGVLLAAVWVGAARAIDHVTAEAKQQRKEEWASFAPSYAPRVQTWLDEARNDAGVLAGRLPPGRLHPAVAGPIVAAFMDGSPVFAREAVVVDATTLEVVAGAQRPGHDGRGPATLVNGALQSCATARSGVTPLPELVNTPGVVRPVRVPWDCLTARVGTAARLGQYGVIVVGTAEEELPGFGHDSRRVSLIGPDYAPDPDTLSEKERARLTSRELYVARARKGAAETPGEYSGTLAAFASAGDGWAVLLEQDLADFEADRTIDEPLFDQGIGATVLVLALGAVLLAFALFEQRRRRAHGRAEEAKHAFFATVGHELRTPLTILKGYSDTLTARWDSLSDDAKEMLVSNMAPAAQRMGALVEKLLLASNIQADAYIKPAPRPTPIPDVLRTVVDRWRPLAPLHTFAVDIDPMLPDAIADADALAQVLGQLVDNAVKYSPSGGRVLVSALRSRRGIDVAVTDDGLGLPPNVREIFDPLVQGEAVDTRLHDEGGAGVGLYIVRTLVRDMGGDVRAERREVRGSRFVVSLKAARTTTTARPTTRV